MAKKQKRKYQKVKIEGVRVAKIKNRYMFANSSKVSPNGHHYYLVYTDKKTGRNFAVRTTHLYVKDPIRFQQLQKYNLMKMTLPGLETPSMVFKKKYAHNASGKPIDFAHRDVRIGAKLGSSRVKRLRNFLR